MSTSSIVFIVCAVAYVALNLVLLAGVVYFGSKLLSIYVQQVKERVYTLTVRILADCNSLCNARIERLIAAKREVEQDNQYLRHLLALATTEPLSNKNEYATVPATETFETVYCLNCEHMVNVESGEIVKFSFDQEELESIAERNQFEATCVHCDARWRMSVEQEGFYPNY